QAREVRRRLGGEAELFARAGVHEAELHRVEHRSPRALLGAAKPGASHIDRFPEQRRSGLAQVDPDLVLATGFEAAGDQRGVPELALDGDMRDGEWRRRRRLLAGLVAQALPRAAQ